MAHLLQLYEALLIEYDVLEMQQAPEVQPAPPVQCREGL